VGTLRGVVDGWRLVSPNLPMAACRRLPCGDDIGLWRLGAGSARRAHATSWVRKKKRIFFGKTLFLIE